MIGAVITLDPAAAVAVSAGLLGCFGVRRLGRDRAARTRLRDTLEPVSAGRRSLTRGLQFAEVPVGDLPPMTLAIAASGALVSAMVVGPVVVVLVIVVGTVGFVAVRHERRRSAQRRADALIPGFLDELASRLRAGRSLRAALEGAGRVTPAPLGPGVVVAARRADLGVPLGESLDAWATAQGSPSLRLVVAALDLATHTGASQVQAVEGVATTLRDRLALAAEVRALASQARASAAVLVVAPVAFAVVIALADPSTAHFLFATPTGLACLAAGLGLDAVGGWWMRRLTAAVG